MKNDAMKARQAIEHAKSIAIFGHMSPDGDCLGGMLGLGRLLEKQKKKIRYFVPNKPGKVYEFIKGIKRLKSNFDYKTYDILIFVDFTGIERMGIIGQAKPEYFSGKNIVIFDHHIDNGMENAILVKDVKSISVCEILFEYTYQRWKKYYDKEVATYLYLGLTSDSGNFMFEEDHIRTFSNALQLLKLGADKDFVVNNLLRKKSLNSVKFLQLLLDRIEQKGDLLYTYYDDEEMEHYGVDQEEAMYALHIIQNIEGPKAVLLMKKIGEVIKGSLRAKNIKGIDCNKIAHGLGGGGHRLAAGFKIELKGNFDTQKKKIIEYISKMIRK